MKEILARYLEVFPGERERLRELQDFLRTTTDSKQLFHRKNFNGHITASGFVLSPDGKKIALVNHKSLHRYLQPGGHVEESDENVLAAARREIIEETGLKNFHYLPFRNDPLFPIDIDSHIIPANPKKNEPQHFHHDFRYLFQAGDETDPNEVTGENGWIWQPIANAIAEPSFAIVAEKLTRVQQP
jgi:8-oxo-dGTP pyrophosphatase MutT (NUDIX family)